MSVTFTGLGPLVVVDAPAPRLPRHALVNSPAAAFLAELEEERVPAGARLSSYPIQDEPPFFFDPCAAGTFREKTDAELPSGFSDGFPTFYAYAGDICTAHSVVAVWEQWKEKTQTALDAWTSWLLERQLAWGTLATDLDTDLSDPYPFLGDSAMAAPAGYSAVAARSAIAYLEDWASQFGREYVLSITPAVATYLGFEVLRADGQQLRTAAGTPVIVAKGIEATDAENVQPGGAGTGDGAEAAAGQSWIFAHLPPKFRVWDIKFPDEPIRDWIDTGDNTVTFLGERALWVGFDGPHAGVLADWTP